MEIKIKIKREMFRFNSKQEWINKAKRWFETSRVRKGNYICVDSIGRVVTCGAEFSRAEAEETYPVIVYEMDGLQ